MTRETPPKVVLLGFLGSSLGVGQSARLLLRTLKRASVEVAAVSLPDPWTTTTCGAMPVIPFRPSLRILCFNADETPLMCHHPAVTRAYADYTIGVWHWEVDRFPHRMMRAFRFVDEIWAGSNFCQRALSAATDKPVFSVPPAIPRPDLTIRLRRSDFGLPEGYLFLFEFDYRSVFERKNPIGTARAFCQAFRPNDGPSLLIKSINGARFPHLRQQLVAAFSHRSDIFFIDQEYDVPTNTALLNLCDVYVSLHRSEGFGLTIAEATALGKPVIATNYSGPLDFLDENNSLLVPFQTAKVGQGHYPYPPSASWADPDLTVAAQFMRWTSNNPRAASALGQRARLAADTYHSFEVRGQFARKRLELILDFLSLRPRVPAPSAVGPQRMSALAWTSRLALARTWRRATRVGRDLRSLR